LATLAGVVFRGDAECVFTADDAVFVLKRASFAFLDEKVKLELVGCLRGACVHDVTSLLLSGCLRSGGRRDLGSVLFRGIEFRPWLDWCAVCGGGVFNLALTP